MIASTQGNLYDNLQIDIEEAHRKIDEGNTKFSHIENYLNRIDKFLYQRGHYAKLIDAGLKRAWFEEFSEYWSQALNGRLLKFHDFFFLYANYRLNFQKVEVEGSASQKKFLYAWQQYQNIYLLFGSVYRYALDPYWHTPYLPYLNKTKGGHILEYGCGAAPLVTSMIKSKLGQYYQFTVADIKGFTYHFAKFRLKQHTNIKFLNLEPYQLPCLEQKYDAVFLQTVLEHLPNPLEVVKELTASLNKRGYFIFDYILSEGHGLDTVEAVDQREEVLRFIEDRYVIVEGKISYNTSTNRTIAIKK